MNASVPQPQDTAAPLDAPTSQLPAGKRTMTLEQFSRIATIVSALVAAAALVWNAHTFKETSRVNEEVLRKTTEQQRETAAATLYQSYLRLAFEHPTFVFDRQDINKLSESEGKKYTIFATISLEVAQQIHQLTDRSNALWRMTIKSIIENHHTFIILNFAACSDLDKDFVEFLKKEVKGYACK
jgi:hypothetical protein